MGNRKIKQKIAPRLMFVGEQCGKAEAAINFYTLVFNNEESGTSPSFTPAERR